MSVCKNRNKVSVAQARRQESVGQDVVIEGWLRTRRDSKAGFSFLEINDGSSFGNVQVLAPAELPEYESVVKSLTAGSSVRVCGTVKESPAAGQPTEVVAASVELVGHADAEAYPLQKKRHSLEFLRTIPHLRSRTNTLGAVTRVRNRICFAIHQFFQEEGFYYVHTPIITASDCEGAGAMFRVSTLDPERLPRRTDGTVDAAQDFFGKPVSLTVSGQLQAETYACGLGKVYTFGPTFRAENSNTPTHIAEFWMIEPEMAFFDLSDNMDIAERFIRSIISAVLRDCREDMEFFDKHIEPGQLAMLTAVAESGFARVSYTEAVQILEAAQQNPGVFEYAVRWGVDLQREHERYLAETHFKRPVIVYDYPKDIKAFYMRLNDDGKTVRAMDVLVPKVGEIIGGSQREERLDNLEARMREMRISPDDYRWYGDLRRYGTVPHSGFGLGLERTVQFITGMANIRDVIPYPRSPGHCDS